MINIQTLNDKHKGREVVYSDRRKRQIEFGKITSWNNTFIFVDYGASNGRGIATRPEDLKFVVQTKERTAMAELIMISMTRSVTINGATVQQLEALRSAVHFAFDFDEDEKSGYTDGRKIDPSELCDPEGFLPAWLAVIDLMIEERKII